jgi:AcrR family transcriptional regulator
MICVTSQPMTPTAAARTRMPALARREQLLDVTARIVAERGFQAVSIQSVARAAGISRPIVYEHFGDLAGLLEALIERETSRALAQVAEGALAGLDQGDPTELMLESLRAYLGAVQRSPDTWRLVLTPPEGAPEMLRDSIRAGRAAVLEQLTNAVRPGLRRGDADPDAELTARVLSAIADEYARLALADPSGFPPDRMLAHARWLLAHLAS